jgi:hypothetical protein
MAHPYPNSFLFSCYDDSPSVSGITNLNCVATAAKDSLLLAATGLAVTAFVISGIMYMTSAGDSAKAQRAKKYVIYSLSAVAVIIGLNFILSIVYWFAEIVGN